jgi:uncharacterized membrane protein
MKMGRCRSYHKREPAARTTSPRGLCRDPGISARLKESRQAARGADSAPAAFVGKGRGVPDVTAREDLMIVRNPFLWGLDRFRLASLAVGSAGRALGGAEAGVAVPAPDVRRIAAADLLHALRRGVDDFMACRTDAIVLCVIYPLAGLVIAKLTFGSGLLPMLFPLAAGFAIIGPFAAIGLYELSRRRERQAEAVRWPDAFQLFASPAFGRIVALGLLLVAIFLAWLGAAYGIYRATLGPEPPVSTEAFLSDVFTTGPGWIMIGAGVGVGFLFALVAFTVGVVSFPLLIARPVSVGTAIATSVRAVAANPGPMALWAVIVAGGLVLGSLPLVLGLIVVLPVLGHATWHLYRRVVAD